MSSLYFLFEFEIHAKVAYFAPGPVTQVWGLSINRWRVSDVQEFSDL